MLRQLWTAAVVGLVLGAAQANAGVQDSSFAGNVYSLTDFSTRFVTADFGDDFDLFVETFEGEDYYGTYEEDEEGFFSPWSVDYLTDDDYEASGVSLFGFITTYYIDQIEGDDDFIGILFRTGDSDLVELP